MMAAEEHLRLEIERITRRANQTELEAKQLHGESLQHFVNAELLRVQARELDDLLKRASERTVAA